MLSVQNKVESGRGVSKRLQDGWSGRNVRFDKNERKGVLTSRETTFYGAEAINYWNI